MAKNAHAAPIVYFDHALSFGHLNGVVQVELAANIIHYLAADKTALDLTTTGHLRCSIATAKLLRDALDAVINLAEGAAQAPAQNGFKDYPRGEARRPS